MSLLAESVSGYLENASWIRRMFEAGGQLKARYGAENVYDFSLGNPDLPAPPPWARACAVLPNMPVNLSLSATCPMPVSPGRANSWPPI